jgi:hypothetical protein
MISFLMYRSGSQEERIGILKLALTEKGVLASRHYDIESAAKTTSTTEPSPSSITQDEPSGDEGLHL